MPVTIKPLEYSESTLSKRLKTVRFINIQGARDITLDLPESGIIRLNASSEVGKSSLLKPFEALVTTKYNTKQEIQSLVTKGCTTGELICELINGTFVALHLDTTNMNKCCYGIQRPGQSLEQLPYPQGLPQILETLGWYTTGLNDKLDFSLNVRLKGVLPIVDTPKRLNTEIFKVALNDSELDNAYNSVNRSLEDVNADLANLKSVLEGAKFALDSLNVEDTKPLENELAILELLDQQDNIAHSLEEAITQVFIASTRKPTQVKAPRHVAPLIAQSEVYTALLQSLDQLLNTSMPKQVVAPKDIPDKLNTLKALTQLDSCVTTILETNKPNLVAVPSELKSLIPLYSNLTKLSITLGRILTLEKPNVKPFNKETLTSQLNTLETLSKLETDISKIHTLISRKPHFVKQEYTLEKLSKVLAFLEVCTENLELLQSERDTLHREMSKYQCPTCGQYYASHDTH